MPKIKLVVWDLDNTLWDGTVYYSDKNNVKLKPGAKEELRIQFVLRIIMKMLKLC